MSLLKKIKNLWNISDYSPSELLVSKSKENINNITQNSKAVIIKSKKTDVIDQFIKDVTKDDKTVI